MDLKKIKPFPIILAILSGVTFILSNCVPSKAYAEDYSYTDLAIDWCDNVINLVSPTDLTVNQEALNLYMTVQQTKQELTLPGSIGSSSSMSGNTGSVGYYYNADGDFRTCMIPTNFSTTERLTGTACLCSSPDFTIYVTISGTPAEDAFYMQYFKSSASFGVQVKHEGTSADWVKYIEIDGGSYFTNSPWNYVGSANTTSASVASLRSTSTIPTITHSYSPAISNAISLTLFGQTVAYDYPQNISDIGLTQLMQPALLNSYLNELKQGLQTALPNYIIPSVPEYNNIPTNNIPNVDIPVFTPILTPIEINGVAVIGAAAGAIVMGGINIQMPILGMVNINGTPFELPLDDLGIDGHTIDFPDDTHFTFDDIPVTINPDGSLTIDGTPYQFPIGQYETVPSENNNFAYEVEMPTLETIQVDNMRFSQPVLSGVSDGVSWWWSVTHTILDDSGILAILPILFGLGLLGFALYKLGG